MTPEERAQLEANLAQAKAALHNLLIGKQVAEASYAMGEGSRTVKYTATNIGQLRSYIADLQQQLGLGRRRAYDVRF